MSPRKTRQHNAASVIRQRSAQTHARAVIRRQGVATLATYAKAAGVTVAKKTASMTGGLRTAAKRIAAPAVDGTAFRKGRKRDCKRYDRLTIHAIATAYAPRNAEYRAARNYLLSI
jgi:hypothetical protein